MTADLDALDRVAREAVAARDWTAAAEAFSAITASIPGDPRPWYSLGLARARGIGLPAAVGSLRRCLILAPDHAPAAGLLAEATGAEEAHFRAAQLPGAGVGTLRIAAALRQSAGDAPGAVALLDRVLAAQPDDAECRVNRAMALIELGRRPAALADIEHALRIDPGDARARWSRGWMRLGRGDWGGVTDYAARWLDPEPDSRHRLFDAPLWDGGALGEGTLLVWSQFGIGDEILFATMVPEAARRAGGRAILEVDPRLVPLLARSLQGITVVARSDPPDPRIASARPVAQTSAARLPAVLPPAAITTPPTVPWLVAEPARTEFWRGRFAALGPAPYIGLSWRSGNRRTAGRKSIALSALAPVMRASSGTWISLQYDPDPEETAEVAAGRRPVPVDNPAPDIRNDLDELAAQIAALDGVVTISGINAHLAGALGTPGLVLMQRDPLWFWFESGETVPWYPSLTLLRQRGTAWDAVIAEAARRVAAG